MRKVRETLKATLCSLERKHVAKNETNLNVCNSCWLKYVCATKLDQMKCSKQENAWGNCRTA